MVTLGQKMTNLRSEIQEYRVNAVDGTARQIRPNQKGRQNATRYHNYCRTNGHTSSWCRKKIRDEKLTRKENERTVEKKSRLLTTKTKNEDQAMNQNNGLEAKISKEEAGTTLTMELRENPPQLIRISLTDQTPHTVTTIRIM